MNTTVNISDVKKLRESTGYGLNDCRKALIDNCGDFQAAIKELREKYASKYENAELTDEDSKIGRVFICSSDDDSYSELKFGFIKAKSDIVATSKELFSLIASSLNSLKIDACSSENDSTENAKNQELFKKAYEDLIVYYREPLIVEKISGFKTNDNEVVGKYLHNQSPNALDGVISAQKAAFIILKTNSELNSENKRKLKDLADLIAMSMIANEDANVLKKEELNEEVVKNFKEKSVLDLQSSGKPANVIEKIVEGQMKKFFEANALIYSSIINPGKLSWLKTCADITIEDALKIAEKEMNVEISIPYYKILRITN